MYYTCTVSMREINLCNNCVQRFIRCLLDLILYDCNWIYIKNSSDIFLIKFDLMWIWRPGNVHWYFAQLIWQSANLTWRFANFIWRNTHLILLDLPTNEFDLQKMKICFWSKPYCKFVTIAVGSLFNSCVNLISIWISTGFVKLLVVVSQKIFSELSFQTIKDEKRGFPGKVDV